MSPLDRVDSSVCHYNPTVAGPEPDMAQDCGREAKWHLLAREGESGGIEAYQACEDHLGAALRMDGVEEYHQFGSGCGLPQSYWMTDRCATEQTLVSAGLAWYEVDTYGKPGHPLPGTYIWVRDKGVWERFSEQGLWVESEPPPGVRV